MNNPLISIVIPLYNKEKSIKTTIESALNQTYKNIEVVVVDDGSTDNSSAIAQELAAQDNRIHFVHQDNSGASAARNRGVRESNGDWIIFFDADDLLYDYCVETIVHSVTLQRMLTRIIFSIWSFQNIHSGVR